MAASSANPDSGTGLELTTMIRRFLRNYLPRHRNRCNQILHMIDVPLTFVGTPAAAAATGDWFWPAICFVTGYALQFAGHAVEGNDAGEVVLVKKALGMPYTEYAPGSQPSTPAGRSDDTTSR
jgi:hypothetical protein